jgi:hypothetical protein
MQLYRYLEKRDLRKLKRRRSLDVKRIWSFNKPLLLDAPHAAKSEAGQFQCLRLFYVRTILHRIETSTHWLTVLKTLRATSFNSGPLNH